MKRLYFSLLIIFSTLISLNAQTYNIAIDNSITTCTGTIYDSGGPTGDYSPNENESIVVYSATSGSQVHLDIEFNIYPYVYDIYWEWGAYLEVYDGEDASAPLIATIFGENGHVNIVGNNASEALFLVFKSTDDLDTLSGFSAEISCGPALPPLPDNDNCANATQICSIDGYVGTTATTHTVDLPGNMCDHGNSTSCTLFDGEIHNNSWISFTAMATSVSLQILIDNCHHTEGVQFGIYSGENCDNFVLLSEYEYTSNNNPYMGSYIFNASGLDVGGTYYFMADGYGGDVCNYELTVISGIMDGSISGPADIYCTPSTYVVNSSATSFEWTGLTGATFTGQGNDTIIVTDWGSLTSATISCEQMAGACLGDVSQLSVNIHPETTISNDATICVGGTATLTQSGSDNLWFEGSCPSLWMEEWNSQPYLLGNTTQNSLVGGVLNVTSTSTEAAIEMSNIGTFDPSIYRYVQIRYKTSSASAGNARIFFYNANNDTVTAGESVQGALISDGNWNTLVIDMHNDPDYLTGGDITGWSYNWCSGNGVTMEIDYIALSSQIAIDYGTSIDVTPTAETTYFVAQGEYCPCVETTVSFSAALTPGQIGSSQSICSNTVPAAFTNITSPTGGTGTWTYEWQYQENCMGAWIAIAGSNTLTYNDGTLLTTSRCYRRKASNDCGDIYSDVIAITVYPGLDGGEIGSDQDICYNTAPAIFTNITPPTGGDEIWTYEWEYQENCTGAWTAMAGSNSLTFTDVTSLTTDRCYRRKASNGCDFIYSNTVTISVYPQITVFAGADQSIPYGTSTSINDAGVNGSATPSGFNYSWTPAGNLIDGSVLHPTTNNLDFTTIFTLTVEDQTTHCTNSDDIQITITGGPLSVVTNGGSASICFGDSIAITSNGSGGSGTYTYSWTSNPAGFTSLDSILLVGPTVTTTYTVQVNDGFNTATSDVIITVNPLPVITVGSDETDDTLCNGENVILTASGNADTYIWDNSVSNGVAFIPTNTDDYIVTATITSTGCEVIDTIQIVVNPLPLITVASDEADDTLCLGEDIILTASGNADTYIWDNSVSNGVAFIPTNTDDYIVTATITSTGCENFDTIQIVVNPLPTITIVSDELDDSLCYGEDVILTASGNADTYIWDNSVSNGVAFIPANTDDYIVTATINSTGCENFDTIQIVVNPLPVINNVAITDVASCISSDGSIDISVNGGTSPYLYSIDTGNTTSASSLFNGLSSGDYSVYVEDLNGCIDTSSATIEGPIIPIIDSLLIANVLCNGDSTGGVIIYSAGATIYSIDSGLTLQNDSVFTGLSVGNYQIWISDAGSCTSLGNLTISEPTELDFSLDNVTDLVCYNDSSGSIQVSATGGTIDYSYVWSNGDITNSISGLNAGIYSVTLSDNNNCIDTMSIEIVQPTQILVTDTSYFENHYGIIDILAVGGTPDYTYNWSNGEISNYISGLSSGEYWVTVSDANGCLLTNFYKIDIDLIIPSVITPNNDGFNDYFRITNIEAFEEIDIKIFNRWGDIVFSYEGTGFGYADQSKQWDGTWNGKELPFGTYMCIVDLKNNKEAYTGTITIVR